MRNRIGALLVVALVLAAAGVVRADRETAVFQAGRGDKALAAEKWSEAEAFYRKALEEDATFLPARYGLAQALLSAGQTAPGLAELRGFAEEAHAVSPLPAEWAPLAAKAEKQLSELDAAGTELRAIIDRYANSLVALGEKWMTKDPVLAERAFRRALKVRPGHARAVEVLGKMGKSAEFELVSLFDGKSLAGWQFAVIPTWQVTEGALVASVRDGCMLIRHDRKFSGDFTLRVEARLDEVYPGAEMFALLPCYSADYDHYSFGMLSGRLRFWDVTGENAKRVVVVKNPTDLEKPWDVKQWNTYEVAFRGPDVETRVNGEVIATEPRPANRAGGFFGLQVQNCRVRFRKVEVEVR